MTELGEILFGEETEYVGTYDSPDYPRRFPVDVILTIVYRDLKQMRRENRKKSRGMVGFGRDTTPVQEVREKAMSGVLVDRCDSNRRPMGSPKREDFPKDDKGWESYAKAHNKWQKEKVNAFLKLHKDKDVFVFEYSDNGEGKIIASMEWGPLFSRVPHLRISKH